MMKKMLLIIILFLQLAEGFCQSYGTLEGVVYDSNDHSGIAGVNLVLIKSDLGTFSDTEGKFTFKDVPAGEDILEYSLIGYGTPRRQPVYIIKDSASIITLYLAHCKFDKFGAGQCPVCNQTDETIPIFYGEPTKKTVHRAQKGKIRLGGCVVSPCNPHYYCKRDRVSY